jgi:hypothetical protein
MKRGFPGYGLVLVLALAVSSVAPLWAADDTATPRPMVDTYDSLADAILATKKTEWNLVHTILASAYRHAQGTTQQALAAIEAGRDAKPAIEALASLVAQIGNEGDASVAAVRKRLVEGGHHHHSSSDQQTEYDPGFVIVTRDAKKGFLDSSKAIARLAASPDAAALKAEWAKVETQFKALHAGSH